MSARRKRYLTKPALAKRLAASKALVLDVDGVLTDDHLYVGGDGFEVKQFHIGDGLTMVLAMRAGLEIIIMSNRPSPATTTRMNDLKVKHVIQARGDKAKLVAEYVAANNLGFSLAEIVFIGNDIMDIPLMREVGVKICVNDAYDELKAMVDYVTVKKGGHGAVREVLELYFKGRGLQPADFLHR
jgi:3-deoxy-D-manno-octulosonate 8-phosphate phosphatase (KDO 8-P phosphatase)